MKQNSLQKMIKTEQTGVYKIQCFGENVFAAFSGREFTNDRKQEFLTSLGFEKSFVHLRQVHSANIFHVTRDQKPGENSAADGMITQESNLALGIYTADCVPVFFFDPIKKVVGIAHAGWRGAMQGIAKKMVQAMRQNFGSASQDIQVAFGPAIRRCCYEVGAEFEEIFPADYAKSREEHGYLDLVAAIETELVSEGIRKKNMHDSDFCTACDNDRFFSHRAEKGTDQRMISMIALLNN